MAGGDEGFADGKWKDAKFKTPRALTIDASGNLYVSDDENNAIRKITPDGDVTTLVGGGPEGGGFKDGPLADVRLKSPAGLVCLDSGEIVVVDRGNDAIRKITDGASSGDERPDPTPTPSLDVQTIAGQPAGGSHDGPALSAGFYGASDVAVDSKGNVYVADAQNHLIRKVASGVVTTFAGQAGVSGSADGSGTAATFSRPRHLALDTQDNLYVTDSDNSTIRKITPAGVVTTLAGQAGVGGTADGKGSAASFTHPRCIAVDTSGNLFVNDDHTVRKITPDGTVTTHAGKAGMGGTADGPAEAARFMAPQGVALDASGNVYVTDYGAIRKIDSNGTVSTLAGQKYGSDQYLDGTGTAARFGSILFITSDTAGNLYVSDYHNKAIRKVTPSGVVTTLTGGPSKSGQLDGTLADAKFFSLWSLKFDASSNALYVAELNTIRRIRLKP
ncbi:Serine/threonine-protein kinase PknD [compost metagenome]